MANNDEETLISIRTITKQYCMKLKLFSYGIACQIAAKQGKYWTR